MSLAFFDVDGTLFAKPSLERRFFWNLQRQRKIPLRNYLAWLAELVCVSPREISTAMRANKMYLRGLSAEHLSEYAAHTHGGCLPHFSPAALQRIWWHCLRGDAIVLVSGTLSPLAETTKFALERELLWRGLEATVTVIATQLEVCNDCWSGRVSDVPMFGEIKARTIREFANTRQIPLAQCSAYGDSSLDRWMLASVGHPFAVNPTRRMRRIVRSRGWQTLLWTHCPLRSADEHRDSKLSDSKLNAGKGFGVGTLPRENESAP